MSEYIKHQPCPECGSRDNLAVYTDHEYCFGCGYHQTYFKRKYEHKQVTVETTRIVLPEDIAPYIPAIAHDWLQKYGLKQKELIDNRVVWSEARELLIFPYFGEFHHLFGWQGRYFGKKENHPKWIGYGNFKEMVGVYHPLTKPENTSIILVEDIISTIKLSRLYNSSCLFGSSINYNKYINIYNQYKPKELIIWLDKDKMKESYIYSYKLNNIGIKTRVISTALDPKLYNNEELRSIVESQNPNSTSSS